MADLVSVHVTIYGYVQGVFFRAFVSEHASKLGLTGYVRNLPQSDAVEVQVDGERKQLEKLITYLKTGPPAARVDRVLAVWSKYTGNYPGFSIRR